MAAEWVRYLDKKSLTSYTLGPLRGPSDAGFFGRFVVLVFLGRDFVRVSVELNEKEIRAIGEIVIGVIVVLVTRGRVLPNPT